MTWQDWSYDEHTDWEHLPFFGNSGRIDADEPRDALEDSGEFLGVRAAGGGVESPESAGEYPDDVFDRDPSWGPPITVGSILAKQQQRLAAAIQSRERLRQMLFATPTAPPGTVVTYEIANSIRDATNEKEDAVVSIGEANPGDSQADRLRKRLERLDRQRDEIEQRLEVLESLPDEPLPENPDDAVVIWFERTFALNGRVYSYAAVRAPRTGRWSTPGPQSPKDYTWAELIQWIAADPSGMPKVWFGTEWSEL